MPHTPGVHRTIFNTLGRIAMLRYSHIIIIAGGLLALAGGDALGDSMMAPFSYSRLSPKGKFVFVMIAPMPPDQDMATIDPSISGPIRNDQTAAVIDQSRFDRHHRVAGHTRSVKVEDRFPSAGVGILNQSEIGFDSFDEHCSNAVSVQRRLCFTAA